jgi:hypothetical protein
MLKNLGGTERISSSADILVRKYNETSVDELNPFLEAVREPKCS